MKHLIAVSVVALFCAFHASAADVTVDAFPSNEKDGDVVENFASDVAKVFVVFDAKGSKKGDKIRAVWIAEDVGDAAPANTKIDEATVTAENDDEHGNFSLSKPAKGWPIGKYRCDIYAGNELESSVEFAIE